MGEEIKIKKGFVFGVIGVVIIGVFLGLAFRNILNTDAKSIDIELVKGGNVGSNTIVNAGDTLVVNLGVANYNYDPETIIAEAGKPVRIVGNMDQLQGCLRAFVIPKLGISKVFEIGNNILEFTPKEKGTFGFSCTMGMGTGSLIVK